MFGRISNTTHEREIHSTSCLRKKRIHVDCEPIELFLNIHEQCESAFILESMSGPRKLAQYSFIGFMPRLTVTAKGSTLMLKDTESDEKSTIKSSDPLSDLKDLISSKRCSEKFRFVGGAVGYISYDAIRYWEKLPKISRDDQDFPDIQMGLYDDCVVFDQIRGDKFYLYRDKDRSDELIELINRNHQFTSPSFSSLRSNIKRDQYEEMVHRAKKYIKSGDILQVVLSKRYDFTIDGDFAEFYMSLRKINPSPYMYFLKIGERKVVGSSPEMMVRVDGTNVVTYPIAGTRPRVQDKAGNRALAKELISDPKERAEHVMLVDLARNDIGRVSRFGSVQVPEFMKIHEYSHVQHLVSKVVGKLRRDCDCYDALRSVFPAGTVSGAPKIRAMEIIEELEPTRRGPYAGAVGYFSYNGNADFAITIRTLVADGARCSIQAGGGIVADSIPQKEWFETEYKAGALIKSLELSEAGK